MEAVRQCAKGRKEWGALEHTSTPSFLLGYCVFRTALPSSGGLPLGDAVEVNCKKIPSISA